MYVYQDKAVVNWGVFMLEELPKALDYIRSDGHCASENQKAW
jgi:hypothetical protein